MNWFTDKIYDLSASPRAGEGAWSELAAQDKMSPATRASYYAGSEMPKDPRNAAWRSQPRMGDVAAMPGTADWMAPPTAQSWEAEHRFAPQGSEISQGDAFWMGGGRPLPQRSAEDAYRMAGLAAMDQYKPNTFRDIDRADIEDRYGGADLHGIKLPPVSKDEPRAWFDAVVPQSPLDVGLMAAGPAGRIAGKGAAALTGAAGVMGELVDPAEAMFAGRLARTANKGLLKRAEDMLAKGANPDEVWTSTGWFKGAGDKMRFEIPDQLAKWNTDLSALKTAREPIRMGEAFLHPELYAAHPKLADVDFKIGTLPGNTRGTYNTGFGVDPPSIQLTPGNALDMRSVNLHELQHGVQELEGFPTGGSVYGGLRPGTPGWKFYMERLQAIKTPTPKADLEKAGIVGPDFSYEEYLQQHKAALKTPEQRAMLDRAAQEYAVRESYRRSAGEVEARNVQHRADRDPQWLRDVPPFWSEDVPPEQQIVKFRNLIGDLADPSRYQR